MLLQIGRLVKQSALKPAMKDGGGRRGLKTAKVASPDFRRVLLPDVAQCRFLGLRYTALDQIAENSTEKDEGERGKT